MLTVDGLGTPYCLHSSQVSTHAVSMTSTKSFSLRSTHMPGMSLSPLKVGGGGASVSGMLYDPPTKQQTGFSLIFGPHGSSILFYPWGAISLMLFTDNVDHGHQRRMVTLLAQTAIHIHIVFCMRRKCPLSHLIWPSRPTSIKTRPQFGSFFAYQTIT